VVAHADAARLRGPTVHVVVSDPRTKRMGLQRLDLATGRATPLHADDVAMSGLPYRLDASDDGRTMVYVAERSSHPAELWVAGADGGRPRRLTELNPQVTRFALGRTRLVEWDGPAGERLRGALLLPAGYAPGRRYPLVVNVYGGDRLSATLNRFGLQPGIDNQQLLATRGYAVLLPDTPLRAGQPLADLAATAMGGVDAVIAMGVADSTRLALMGHSYGGYSVLAILVQTERFRAAVSSGGFASLLTHYGAMREDGSAVGVGWSEREQGRMGGSPWEHRERYIANSPYFFLDRIRTPVLLLHGGADHTVHPREAEETFVALRRLGKEATLVRYEGEGHHPGSWRAANAEDYWTRVFEWLARHLRHAW
jgi:dipeptidyl aminopeptidase/acylaminoacyl peptidase